MGDLCDFYFSVWHLVCWNIPGSVIIYSYRHRDYLFLDTLSFSSALILSDQLEDSRTSYATEQESEKSNLDS